MNQTIPITVRYDMAQPSPAQVEAYLIAHQWWKRGTMERNGQTVATMWANNSDDSYHEALVPAVDWVSDYRWRVVEVIDDCAEIENRNAMQVYLEMVSCAASAEEVALDASTSEISRLQGLVKWYDTWLEKFGMFTAVAKDSCHKSGMDKVRALAEELLASFNKDNRRGEMILSPALQSGAEKQVAIVTAHPRQMFVTMVDESRAQDELTRLRARALNLTESDYAFAQTMDAEKYGSVSWAEFVTSCYEYCRAESGNPATVEIVAINQGANDGLA